MNTRTALTDTTDTNTLSLHAASGTRQLLRVRVDTDTRFSHTIKSRKLYTDEGQMERKGQFSLIGKTAFVRKKRNKFYVTYQCRTKTVLFTMEVKKERSELWKQKNILIWI
jgi:hypothetical protein